MFSVELRKEVDCAFDETTEVSCALRTTEVACVFDENKLIMSLVLPCLAVTAAFNFCCQALFNGNLLGRKAQLASPRPDSGFWWCNFRRNGLSTVE